jgi:BlaI family transcriptional regulator, penicillinase repressor
MDILFRRGEATVADIMAELPDPPTYSAVRSVLRILAQKGLAMHKADGPRYVYLPAQPTERARDAALEHLVDTYFAGSTEQAVTALLKLSDADLSDREITAFRERIRKAREGGR